MEEKDREFYDKAYAYFSYHAEQRTTMINFFIGVFGACIALYGSLIASLPVACVLISTFLFIVTVLFYCIDIRNKFDVKQSQRVICAFEQKYGVSAAQGQTALGVFSNEDNAFLLYDRAFRKSCAEYRELKRNFKKLSEDELREKIGSFVAKHPNVSEQQVRESLSARSIPHLSSCIKTLYYICMAISLLGIAASLLVCFL